MKALGLLIGFFLAFDSALAHAESPTFGGGGGRAIARGEDGAEDLRADAMKLFVAFPISKSIPLEIQFVDLGEYETTEDFGGGFTGTTQFDVSGFSLGVAPHAKLLDGLQAFIKLGLLRWSASGETVVYNDMGQAVAGANGDDKDFDPFGGIGLKLALGDSLFIRAEFERFKVDDVDIDAITAGLEFVVGQ